MQSLRAALRPKRPHRSPQPALSWEGRSNVVDLEAAMGKASARLQAARVTLQEATRLRQLGYFTFSAGTVLAATAILILWFSAVAGAILVAASVASTALGARAVHKHEERAADAAQDLAALMLELDRLHREQQRAKHIV